MIRSGLRSVTTTGQAIVLVLDIFAVSVGATLAGMFGAYFYHRTEDRRASRASRSGRHRHDDDS